MEHSGGHYFDTGDGPRPLSLLAASAALLESDQLTAYRTYLTHATTCEKCPKTTWQCEEAARLWEAYRSTRS